MDDWRASGLDILESFESLKKALSLHFSMIRQADSSFGYDHAELLKSYIDYTADDSGEHRILGAPVFGSFIERPALLPRAIARFASQATCSPSANLGTLCALPREIRDIIYDYALSVDCHSHLRTCSCNRQARKGMSGVALLRTSGRIHNEAVPILYRSELFGIHLGYKVTKCGDGPIEWTNPTFYRERTLDHQAITSLPHNALHLIQNLEITFTTDIVNDDQYGPSVYTDEYLYHIRQLCTNLKDCVQFQYLDINLSFTCKTGDIEYMACLLEPIKMLRGIREPNITVFGYQHNIEGEPRWGLTDQYTEYMEELLKSPYGAAAPPTRELQVFDDLYDCPESPRQISGEAESLYHEDEHMIRGYLLSEYGTEDLTALHGGLPLRNRNFLYADHEEGCDWFD